MSRKSWVDKTAGVLALARRAPYRETDVAFVLRLAIEECARQVRDTDVVEAPGINGTYYAQLGDAAVTREACAKAILALLEPGDEGETP